MKVILNVDVKSLGEEGDVKNVAAGYARNYLLPRNLAVPCTPETMMFFEARKAEIEARKEQKRKDSAAMKEKLEALTLDVVMPASSNGKLFGAVTPHVIAEALAKAGFDIERKRIDLSGAAIKTVGNYKTTVKLYETMTAEVHVAVKAQTVDGEVIEEKAAPAATEEKAAPAEEKAE